jgi:hypothetical protein
MVSRDMAIPSGLKIGRPEVTLAWRLGLLAATVYLARSAIPDLVGIWAVALAMCIGGTWLVDAWAIHGWVRVPGSVEKVASTRVWGVLYAPSVEWPNVRYTTRTGQRMVFQGRPDRRYAKGESVVVAYDPGRPDAARIVRGARVYLTRTIQLAWAMLPVAVMVQTIAFGRP